MTFTFNLPVKINIPGIPFRSTAVPNRNSIKPLSDGFSSNPIYGNLDSREQIEATAKQNYKIQSLLSEHNLPLKVNLEELENLKQGHLKETRIITAKIYSSLPDELKKDVDIACLQEAALLHDYGKVLIPKDILNKKGKLTYEERKVMELHSELGYELLKNKNINEKTLNLIKYHHQNLKGTGYPEEKNYEHSIEAQILSTADKYTALREKRSYKNPLGKYEALEIIAKEVSNGDISQEIYTALIKSV